MGSLGVFDGGLQSFSGFARGKTRGASGYFRGWVECENAASGVHKRAESLLVQGATHGDRSDVRAFVCQFRAGIQAVSAIVSRAYQQGHASILDGEILVVEQCHGHVGRRRSGHAHQRRAVVKQRTFQLAHGIGVVSAVQ